MIVTTTNSIERSEISRYNDPIAANVVIDTDILSIYLYKLLDSNDSK
jgi:uncharacterized protein YbjQ (UPF0145 family)